MKTVARTNEIAASFRESIRENAILLLTVGNHDDPDYVQTEAEFYAVWERIRDLCSSDVRPLLGALEEAMTAHVAAAEDAVARAWLRERGSIPVSF